MVARSIIFLALGALAVCNPLGRRTMKVHESRSEIPTGFVKQGRAAPDTVISMRVALTQNDPEGLTDALMAVSTPGSARYQSYLTLEEIATFTTPSEETSSAVISFLRENGINPTTISHAGDWLAFDTTVAKANELFAADFHVFKHEHTGTQNLVTMEYSVPVDLSDHIQLVHPTISFSTAGGLRPQLHFPKSEPSRPSNLSADVTIPSSCTQAITPACLEAIYAIPSTPAEISSNTIGVAGFIGQFANQADLATFLKLFRPDIPPQTVFKLDTLDGGSNSQNEANAGIEADIDIEYTVGVATNVPTTFISCGSNIRDSVGGFLDWANFVAGLASPPQVVTTSYGENENVVSPNAANALCNVYQQLGARGVSVLFSSGDGGVAGSQTTQCTTFLATFPSGCPFMTSVGATNVIADTGTLETAATFSSGGFSNVFTRPSYQSSAVSAYLSKLGSTNSGKFNTAGRGFPDVAAAGENVEIVFQQQLGLVAGTSCSSPIFASIIALINDRLAQQGKGPLGFLNPLLYGPAATTFTDITTGNNPGCGTNGFPATVGWDPVTGLGSPNFPALLAAAEAAAGL